MNMHMNHSMSMTNGTTGMHHNHMTTTTMGGMGGMGGMGEMDGMDNNGGGHNHHMPMPMGNGTSDRTCAGDMLMFFHTGKCEFILFEDLRTKDVGGLVGACLAIFALAILYEALKVFREHLLQRSMVTNNKYTMSNGSSSQDAMVVSNKNVGPAENGKRPPPSSSPVQSEEGFWVHMMSGGHFFQTILHMVQVFISYCLMLVFMTYNVWLCLSVVVGAGIGYFLFGWRKAIVVDINEHCH